MGSYEVQVESQTYIPSVSIDDGREEPPLMEELDDAERLLGGWGAEGDTVQNIEH